MGFCAGWVGKGGGCLLLIKCMKRVFLFLVFSDKSYEDYARIFSACLHSSFFQCHRRHSKTSKHAGSELTTNTCNEGHRLGGSRPTVFSLRTIYDTDNKQVRFTLVTNYAVVAGRSNKREWEHRVSITCSHGGFPGCMDCRLRCYHVCSKPIQR